MDLLARDAKMPRYFGHAHPQRWQYCIPENRTGMRRGPIGTTCREFLSHCEIDLLLVTRVGGRDACTRPNSVILLVVDPNRVLSLKLKGDAPRSINLPLFPVPWFLRFCCLHSAPSMPIAPPGAPIRSATIGTP